jgi:small subunit ribosomal protein S1
LVDDHYQVGQLVEGRVTRVLDFGAFVELDLGVEGLLHASEMIGTPELSPSDIVHSGEKLLIKIIRIDSRKKRLALSAKQVRRNEWERWVSEQQAAQEDEGSAAPVVEGEPVVEATGEDVAAPEAMVGGVPEELPVPEDVVEEAAAPEAETSPVDDVAEEAVTPEAGVVVEEASGESPVVEEGTPVPDETFANVAEEKPVELESEESGEEAEVSEEE